MQTIPFDISVIPVTPVDSKTFNSLDFSNNEHCCESRLSIFLVYLFVVLSFLI